MRDQITDAMSLQTLTLQEAKKECFLELMRRDLPIPHDLADEMGKWIRVRKDYKFVLEELDV